jgi:hypothetical protein
MGEKRPSPAQRNQHAGNAGKAEAHPALQASLDRRDRTKIGRTKPRPTRLAPSRIEHVHSKLLRRVMDFSIWGSLRI